MIPEIKNCVFQSGKTQLSDHAGYTVSVIVNDKSVGWVCLHNYRRHMCNLPSCQATSLT